MKFNEKQTLFLKALENADGKALTLAEISNQCGVEIKTGSIVSLITKEIIKCNKNAHQNVCACCGHKTNVSTYELNGVVNWDADEQPKAKATKVEKAKDADEVLPETEAPLVEDADEDLD